MFEMSGAGISGVALMQRQQYRFSWRNQPAALQYENRRSRNGGGSGGGSSKAKAKAGVAASATKVSKYRFGGGSSWHRLSGAAALMAAAAAKSWRQHGAEMKTRHQRNSNNGLWHRRSVNLREMAAAKAKASARFGAVSVASICSCQLISGAENHQQQHPSVRHL